MNEYEMKFLIAFFLCAMVVALALIDAFVRRANSASDEDRLDAERYRWLRAGNGYTPEECGVSGGPELDELCDQGIKDGSYYPWSGS